jgi:hypothetical protein
MCWKIESLLCQLSCQLSEVYCHLCQMVSCMKARLPSAVKASILGLCVMLRQAIDNWLSTSRLDHDTALPEEELTNYVGLLHLLSDEVMQRQREIKFNRKLHAYSVLSEQQTQRKRRASCEKKLARISSMNSLEARGREHFMWLNCSWKLMNVIGTINSKKRGYGMEPVCLCNKSELGIAWN